MKNFVSMAEYNTGIVLCTKNDGANQGTSDNKTAKAEPVMVTVGNHQYREDSVVRSTFTITSAGTDEKYSSDEAYAKRYATANGHNVEAAEDDDVDVPAWKMWFHTLEHKVISWDKQNVVDHGKTMFFTDWEMTHAVATNMILRELFMDDIMTNMNSDVFVGCKFNVVQIKVKKGELVHNPFTSSYNEGFKLEQHDGVITVVESIKLDPFGVVNGIEQMGMIKAYAETMAKKGFDAEDIIYTLEKSDCIAELDATRHAMYVKHINAAVEKANPTKTEATPVASSTSDNSAMMMQMMQMMMQMMNK